jgi:hypothetical protein
MVLVGGAWVYIQAGSTRSRVAAWSQLTGDYDNDGKIGVAGQDPCPCTVNNKLINYKGDGYCMSDQDSSAFNPLRSHFEESTAEDQGLLENGLITPENYNKQETSINRDVVLYDPDLCAATIVDEEIDWPNR